MKIIAQGAEAKIIREHDSVVKNRFSKKYRHPVLDSKLRKARTKREAKVMQKLAELNIPASRHVAHDDENITMEFLDGDVLKDVFDTRYKEHAMLMGKNIALLHKHGIIHGDLTTSNMILHDGELHFIDFGLSFFSIKPEDMAVDLHLLRQALESKHHAVFEGAFDIILKEYAKHFKDSEKILHRLDIVEKRGRHKQQY